MRFFKLDDAKTMYGMVNSNNFDISDMYTVKNGSCRFCGQPSAMHVLHSTLTDSTGVKGTFGLANDLINEILNQLNTHKNSKFISHKEKMIGVLRCKNTDRVYASHSGKFNDKCFLAACKSLGYEYSPAVTPGTIKDRNRSLVRDEETQYFDYQCAAPRMIQHAINDGYFPIEMTEMCFKGNTPGRVAGSCGRCRITIPKMMCPTEPDFDRLRKINNFA